MTHVYLPHIARNMHSPGRWEHYQQLVKALLDTVHVLRHSTVALTLYSP